MSDAQSVSPSETVQDELVKPKFIHLRVHSAYSLLEGALPLKTIGHFALSGNMPAIAVTDRNNLFGALEFADMAVALGVQPIIGTSLCVTDGEDAKSGWLALYAKDATGYGNLMALVSAAHLDSDGASRPAVTWEALAAHTDGLICLSGGPDGPANGLLQNGQTQAGLDVLTRLNTLFAVTQ
jgi:DNA polymerase-3 subunit alpha